MSDEKKEKKNPDADLKYNHYNEWPELKKNPYLSPIEAMWAYGKYEPGSYMKNFQKGNEMEKRLEYARVKNIVNKNQLQFENYVQRGKYKKRLEQGENEKKP